jgi:hypothetical protein
LIELSREGGKTKPAEPTLFSPLFALWQAGDVGRNIGATWLSRILAIDDEVAPSRRSPTS